MSFGHFGPSGLLSFTDGNNYTIQVISIISMMDVILHQSTSVLFDGISSDGGMVMQWVSSDTASACTMDGCLRRYHFVGNGSLVEIRCGSASSSRRSYSCRRSGKEERGRTCRRAPHCGLLQVDLVTTRLSTQNGSILF